MDKAGTNSVTDAGSRAARGKWPKPLQPMKLLIPLLGLMLVGAAPDEDARCHEDNPRMRVSDMQYVTTHNAFHIAPDEAVLSFVRSTRRGESENWPIDKIIAAHNYTHPTLTQQLMMGVRSFEIDVHDDPSGGRFSKPDIYDAMPRDVVNALPSIDPLNDLTKPGFKTFHEVDYDMRSTCLLFRNCLKEISKWHKDNKQHIPIFILIEIKNDVIPRPDIVNSNSVWHHLQKEILSEFSLDDMIIPSEIEQNPVRWPIFASARGKVVFLLFDYGHRPVERYAAYISTSGDRALFHIEKDVGALRATWQSRNDPSTIESAPFIKPGLLLYTKGDTTGVQDFPRAKSALSSPANFVATDFLTPDTRRSNYSLSINGKYIRSICGRKQGARNQARASRAGEDGRQ